MARYMGLLLVLALADPELGVGQAASPLEQFELGRRQFGDGAFEAALFTLDSVVRKLTDGPDSADLLTRAYVYLGAAYIALDREDVARAKFRQALRLRPQLRLAPDEFPARTIKVFERELLSATTTHKKKTGKILVIAGGVGGAAAVAAVTMSASGRPANRPPTVTMSVTPSAALVSVTRVTLTAQARDPDGDALTYAWDLGDGSSASIPSVEHVYEREGTFTATVTVSDGRGGSVQATSSVQAKSLNGIWVGSAFETDAQQLHCSQDNAFFRCDPVVPITVVCPRSCPCSYLTFFVGSLSHPRQLLGEYVHECGGKKVCEGDIRDNSRGESLSKIACAPFGAER